MIRGLVAPIATVLSVIGSLAQVASPPVAVAVVAIIIASTVVTANPRIALIISIPGILGCTATAWMLPDATRIEAAGVLAIATLASVVTLHHVRAYPTASQSEPREAAFASSVAATFLSIAIWTLTIGSSPALAFATATAMFGVALVQAPIVGPMLHRSFQRKSIEHGSPDSDAHHRNVLKRFAHLPPIIRGWARGKIWTDPLFRSLHRHVSTGHILDAGCGYGLCSAWLAVAYPRIRITAIDSLSDRVRVAKYVIGSHAQVDVADIECLEVERSFDAVLCIDVLHHLRDPGRTAHQLSASLRPGGVFLLRTTVREARRGFGWERLMVSLRGQRTVRFYDEAEVIALLETAGLCLIAIERCAGRAETLFIAKKATEAQ